MSSRWKTVEQHIKGIEILKTYMESAIQVNRIEKKITGKNDQERLDFEACCIHDYQEAVKKLAARFEYEDAEGSAKIIAYLLKIG